MLVGLDIERKYDLTPGTVGMLLPSELNKLVALMDHPMVVTETENTDNNGLLKAIHKISESNVYTEDVPGDGQDYVISRIGLTGDFNEITVGTFFTFIPKVNSVDGEAHSLSINGSPALPLLTNYSNDILRANDLVAGLAYTVVFQGNSYIIIDGIAAHINGNADRTFKVSSPVEPTHAVNLGTLVNRLTPTESTGSTWVKVNDFNIKISDHSAIYYNNGTHNLMVIYGGFDENGYALYNTWEYNIDLDIWTELTYGPFGRVHHTSTFYWRYTENGPEGIMVVHGGYDNNWFMLKDTWEYNLTTNTWTELEEAPMERAEHTAVLYTNDSEEGYSNFIVFYGGFTLSSNEGGEEDDYNEFPTASTYKYDLDTDTWTQLAYGPYEVTDHTAILYHDGTYPTMIVYGGNDDAYENISVFSKYNIETDEWSIIESDSSSTPPLRAYHSAAIITDLNKMIIHGGYSTEWDTLKDTWEYDLDTDTWTELDSSPIGRYGHTSILYNDGNNNIMVTNGGLVGEEEMESSDTYIYNLGY